MRTSAIAFWVAILQVQSGAAQQPGATGPAAAPKVGWQVDWSNNRCSLTHHPGAANQIGFSMRLIPGATQPELMVFVNTASLKMEVPKPGKGTIELQPVGFKGDVNVAPQSVDGAQALIFSIYGLDSRFLDKFGKSEQLALAVGPNNLSVPMKNTGKALEALQQCVDESLAELGFDPKALGGLRSRPEGEWRQLFTIVNYPAASLRAKKGGLVAFRATIGTDGRVSKCTVVQSSGTQELDDQTCSVLTTKGRFKPAVAADGSKVAAPFVDFMMWEPQMAMRGRR
jgi:TonB family protein